MPAVVPASSTSAPAVVELQTGPLNAVPTPPIPIVASPVAALVSTSDFTACPLVSGSSAAGGVG